MLAGQDGPGGIVFNNYSVTYLVGSVALAVILFDGGLRTRLSVFRGVLAPSLLLATVGRAAHRRDRRRSPPGRCSTSTRSRPLLLGAIIASTDAAAVFFLLRTGGLRLQTPGRRDLEIEFGHQRPDRGLPRVIVLTEFILAGGGIAGWELALELVARRRSSAPRSASPAASRSSRC